MEFHVFVPGVPRGQPRPRAFARGGVARVYDPGTAEAWKQAVAIAAAPVARTRYTGAVMLVLSFRFRRPKGHYTRRGDLRTTAPRLHVQKPDLDNLAKAVMDALTIIGAWRDDAQILELRVDKAWTDGEAGCQIGLYGWGGYAACETMTGG